MLDGDSHLPFRTTSQELFMRHRLVLAFAVFAVLAAACSSETSVFDLSVGDCFNDQEDLTVSEVSRVATVDCSEPHDNEIYFEYSMTDAVFPGNDAAMDSAVARCLEEFDAFVGIDYSVSELELFPITPTSVSWAEGDRVVYCAIYELDLSKLEGTVRGARR
jgi:hypothetical protein